MTTLSRTAALAAAVLTCALAAVGCPDLDESPPPAPPPPTKVDPPPAQETVIAPVRPPPISGGTLLVSRAHAFASDPDRDRVIEIAIGSGLPAVARYVQLAAGEEPGRLVEDASDRVHVLARGTGAVVSIDRATGEVAGRRWACPAPRGLAFDEATDTLVVACVGGELVRLAADPSVTETKTRRIDADLRDVFVQGERLLVTRFRSAEVLVVGADGEIVSRSAPRDLSDPATQQKLAAAVGWRAVPLPGGGIVQMHQRAMASTLPQPSGDTPPAYYGPSCHDAIVQSAITLYDGDGALISEPGGGRIPNLVLPVDVAISRDGARVAAIGAANGALVDVPIESLRAHDACALGIAAGTRTIPVPGEPIAVAYGDGGRLFVQTRQPSLLWVIEPGATSATQVALGGDSVRDTGHTLFHGNPDGTATIACASCHPEGRDDGRVYVFSDQGPRRTMSLEGGMLETAPFHWAGDLDDMDDLMDEIFVGRMGGRPQNPTRLSAIATYVESLAAVPASPAMDPAAAARGRAIFEDDDVGCATCHAGPRLTDNATVDVGTGGKFQVPTLRGVAHAGPYMHNGCAKTLRDRFTAPCGGGDEHGHTSQLEEAELADLIAYLETL